MEAAMYRTLLLFLTALVAGPAQAYVILESKYHVEVSPGVFEDQLVLKCDNGRKLTVPWEARLSEACGEVQVPKSAQGAEPQDLGQERRKELIMSRAREPFGNIDERHLQVDGAPGSADAHFSPEMRAILKRYEICRKETKGSPACAAERDRALAALAGPSSAPAAQPAAEPQAGPPQPGSKGKPGAREKQAAENGNAAAGLTTKPEQPAAAAAKPEPATTTGPEVAPAAPAVDRAAAEQKIAEDYAWCMRAKPKFECETARASALKALDAPVKPKAKSKPAKAPKVATN
jgi:hypothetical protein